MPELSGGNAQIWNLDSDISAIGVEYAESDVGYQVVPTYKGKVQKADQQEWKEVQLTSCCCYVSISIKEWRLYQFQIRKMGDVILTQNLYKWLQNEQGRQRGIIQVCVHAGKINRKSEELSVKRF